MILCAFHREKKGWDIYHHLHQHPCFLDCFPDFCLCKKESSWLQGAIAIFIFISFVTMRGSIWTSDVILGLTILISTIFSSCVVICLENESGPQQQDDVNLMTSSSGSNSRDPSALYLQQPLSDRYIRNYYEVSKMYVYTDKI